MPTLTYEQLKDVNSLLSYDIDSGREKLIKLLDLQIDEVYRPVINSLLEKAGLYQYVTDFSQLDFRQKILVDLHRPFGMEDVILHGKQAEVYRYLLDGDNVILSAPTSFGKSLLIDAVIASRKYSNIVIIVPTIALIEETRSRISKKFSEDFKIISFPSQKMGEKNICIFTQERYLEANIEHQIDFFVIDEFYKLNEDNGERKNSLNEAFYKLLKQKSQFFMIGPNIETVQKANEFEINYRFIKTDFKTVALDVFHIGINGVPPSVPKLCKIINGQTLIFCQSNNSAYKLGADIEQELSKNECNQDVYDFVCWLEQNYSPKWTFVKLLRKGIGVHHAGLPRSIARYVLNLFNEGKIKFLLCTNTIIEGVNTNAKNMIIYDHKIATKNFDRFTFNNICGRAGRMFKHYVGNVYLNGAFDYQESLPIVDIPVLGQQSSMPETLLLGMYESDLSDESKERLKYLHAQNILPYDIIKKHNSIYSQNILNCADEIRQHVNEYNPLLNWKSLPEKTQIDCIAKLVFEFLLDGKRKENGVLTSKQLAYRIKSLKKHSCYAEFIKELVNVDSGKSVDVKIDDAMKFIRNWCDFILPNCLDALNDIQTHIFSTCDKTPGDYTFFIQKIRNYFDKEFSCVLEEVGLPIQIYSKMGIKVDESMQVDDVIKIVKNGSVKGFSQK